MQREDAQGAAAASGRGKGGGNGGSPIGFFGAMFSGWGGKEKKGEERFDSSSLEDDTASSCDDDSTPWNKPGDAMGLFEENSMHFTYEDKDYHYGSQGDDQVGEGLGDKQTAYGGQSSMQSGTTQSRVVTGARVASRVARANTPRCNNVLVDYVLRSQPESQPGEGGGDGSGGGKDGDGGWGGSGDSDSSVLGDNSDSVHQSGDVTLHLSALTADDEITL